jgi:tetratricopeptide (TPR) repeat protein
MRSLSLVVVGLLIAGSALGAGSYSGEWAYQALNAGDTNFKVEQEGGQITFYRVLFPEYEGSKYKLEHMYKGEVRGRKVEGKMFVREEGMPDFQFLRTFSGEIEGDDRMEMDGMVLKRAGDVIQDTPETRPATKYTGVVIQRKPQEPYGEHQGQQSLPPPDTEPAAADQPPSADQPADAPPPEATASVQAPAEIPKLIQVGRKIETPLTAKVEKLLGQGDALYGKKSYTAAVLRYEEALKLDPAKVELLYKLGLGHGTLGTLAARAKKTDQARAHYEQAIGYWEKAYRFDPYNTGARENIKRAKEKLSAL